jgi:hypothetical protein
LRRRATLTTVLAFALAVLAGIPSAVAAVSGSERARGSLDLNANLYLKSLVGGCPLSGNADECAARTVAGSFPGLGQITGTYSFLVDIEPPECAASSLRALAFPIHLIVASKGEIQAAVAETSCVQYPVATESQTFTITGGTGVYAGATGSGTLSRTLGNPTDSGRIGNERWTGTLSVPGLEFDLTPPTLSGATSKTVKAKKRAKSARVTYQVIARDDRDGSVPVTCSPKSGSRFEIGRTKVICAATDTSANATQASFTIRVKATR